MFSDLNSNYNMIEMQESLVKALVFRFGNKTDAAVKAEAIVLRDMLASQKEAKLFRKIEA